MREAGRITAMILDSLNEFVKPGISTEETNTLVHKVTIEQGGRPAPLNYKGFPKSVCTSINDVICHGIPDAYSILKNGDIINIDITTCKSGFYADSSRMYYIGGKEACSPAAVKLVETTKEALYKAIDVVRPGAHIGDIGAAIQELLKSKKLNYGIVREYTGHGIGREFHEAPQVLHVGRKGAGEEMKPGMTFTIEPMINAGSHKTVLSKLDGWTVRTADGSLSAQWEHTVLVTHTGSEILTPPQID